MTAAAKLDLYKAHKAEYVTPKSPVLLDTNPASYLAVEGQGEPGGAVFQSTIGSLYSVAFTIKMAKKFAGRDYTVCKLEGFWWAGRKKRELATRPPSEWNWRLLIRVPTFIRQKDLDLAIEALTEKGKGPGVSEVRLETLEEGRCVQMLHIGPYPRVPETIALMKQFAEENGLSFHGLHHEIYLSDPRRVAEAKLRTILRHPVR